jgi:large subunit ribosomal protein L32
MAVPKKQTSVSRKGKRRAGQHHKLYRKHPILDKESGEFTLRHKISPSGMYKGKQVFELRERGGDEVEGEEQE